MPRPCRVARLRAPPLHCPTRAVPQSGQLDLFRREDVDVILTYKIVVPRFQPVAPVLVVKRDIGAVAAKATAELHACGTACQLVHPAAVELASGEPPVIALLDAVAVHRIIQE